MVAPSAALDDAVETGDSTKLIQRRAVLANMGVVTVATVTGGPLGAQIFQLYASRVLGLSAGQIGLALGILVVTIPAPFLGVAVAKRLGKRPTMIAGYSTTIVLLLPFFFFRALMNHSFALGYAALVAVLIAKEFAFSGTWSAIWFSWMRDFVDPGERGRFFARMRSTVQAFGIVVLLVFSLLVGSRMTAGIYDTILAFVIAYLILAVVLISNLPEGEAVVADPPTPKAEGRRFGRAALRMFLKSVLVNDTVARLTAINVLLLTMSMPLFALYATSVLGFDDRTVARLLIVQSLATVSTLRFWGRWTDRYGYRRILRINAAAMILVTILWLFVRASAGTDTTSVVLVAVIVGATGSILNGAAIAALAGLGDVVESKASLNGYAGFNAMRAASRYVFLALSGAILSAFGRFHWTILRVVHVDGFRVFVLSGIATGLLVLLLVSRLPTDVSQ